MKTIQCHTSTPVHSMMIGGNAVLEDVTSFTMNNGNFEEYFRNSTPAEWEISQRGTLDVVKFVGVIIGYGDSSGLTLTIMPVPGFGK